MRTKLIITTAAVVAAGAAAGIAVAGGDDGEGTASGPSADRARTAALALFPDGRATAVERDREDGATWEVEVARADGRTVDVRLDERFRVVVVEGDSEDEDR